MLNFIKNIFDIRSGRWNTLRLKWLSENDTCIACGTKSNLQVHHIEPVSKNAVRELDYGNLCTLCKTCHFVFGHLHNWNNINPHVIEDCKKHLKRIDEYKIKPVEKKSFWNFF